MTRGAAEKKNPASVEMTARCTSCRKVYRVTLEQMREAETMGCLFSPCCMAPATPESATVRAPRKRKA